LVTIYIIYYLDLLPHSHDPAAVANPDIVVISNSTTVEDTAQVAGSLTDENEPVAVVDAERDAAINQAAAAQAAAEQAAVEQAAAAIEQAAFEQDQAEQVAMEKEAFIKGTERA
jgi:hypothetical protein